MPPIIVLILCVVLIIVLLGIERRRSMEVSPAVWIPTIWVLISGSRPLERWFESSQSFTGVSEAAGSPLNRLVLGSLILLSILVIFRRKIEWSKIRQDNFWLILLYLYMGVSILWSDYPYLSFKRWSRSIGDIVIALVVLSEQKPLQALMSILRRCAYVLVPLSIVLIKYFPHLGRSYHRWTGHPMWTGVATQKNSLGQLCMLSGFLLIWALLLKWRSGDFFKTKSQTFADLFVLATAVYLLIAPDSAYSATSIGVFIVGVTTMIMLDSMHNLARFIARHLKAILVVLVFTWVILRDTVTPMISSMLGRDETLTGRTDIWDTLLDAASHKPIFGFGYGGFWGMGREVEATVGVSQAHNGFLDIYLELGAIGIVLFVAFLSLFCAKVHRMINHAFEWGVYGICLILISLFYNYGESSFIQQGSYLWTTMVFFTVVFSESADITKAG